MESTFSFFITVNKSEASQVIEKTKTFEGTKISALSNLNILLAEDNIVNIKMITIVLKKLEHNVTVAVNGAEVIKLLTKQSFNVILMDIEMPVLDGIQTTLLIRDGKVWKNNINIPIITISAHVLPEIKGECIDARMNGFINKPIQINELNTVISKILKQQFL
jgi:CheY-like chemotaxis protein